MENITLGFAMCGSFCTFDPVLTALEALKAQYPDIIPILSPASASTDTRFGTAAHFRSRLESICGHDVWDTIAQVEPIGPKKLLDALIVAPATGNTLAKLACGIADKVVTLAVNGKLLNERRVRLGDGQKASAGFSPAGTTTSFPCVRTRRTKSRAPSSRISLCSRRRSRPRSAVNSSSRSCSDRQISPA